MASARPSRRTRQWTSSTVVALAALALAGCSATNPITTAEAYNVVDGVEEELGSDVAARGLLVFAAEEGAPGVLAGALANRGRQAVEVTLEADGADAVTIEVPAGGAVLLGGDNGEEVELERVDAPPGALLTITATTDDGTTELRVPVFDDTLPEYEDAVPAAE